MSDEEVPTEFTDMVLNPEGLDPDADTAIPYAIAEWVQENFHPGFVIIGSPNYFMTQDGTPYPDAIGIVIKHDRYTKVDVAAHLETLVKQLRGDIEKVENFLREAIKDD